MLTEGVDKISYSCNFLMCKFSVSGLPCLKSQHVLFLGRDKICLASSIPQSNYPDQETFREYFMEKIASCFHLHSVESKYVQMKTRANILLYITLIRLDDVWIFLNGRFGAGGRLTPLMASSQMSNAWHSLSELKHVCALQSAWRYFLVILP